MAEKGNLKQDDLIAKLVKDPKAPPDALLLSGFLGASSEDDHTRLYLTATLDDYVEIPSDAILHTQEIPKDQSPLGGTLLWIKKDAELIHGKVGPNRTKAKFLEGRIQQEFVKAQAAGGPVALAVTIQQPCPTQFGHPCPTLLPAACPTHHPPCTVTGPACPTHVSPCTHAGPFCPTAGPTILPCCHPSLATPCPSHPLIACPTNPIICTHLGPQCHPSLIVPGCTHFGPECPIHTLQPQCPIHTVAPPCPVGSGPFCGGVGGSAACQPGGPVQVGPAQAAAHFAAAQAFQQPSIGCLTVPACSVNAPNCPTTDFACTVVGLNCPSQQGICTAVDPNCNQPTQQFPCAQTLGCPPTQNLACPTHHLGCTVDLRTCINTVNPQQCPVLSANCPTPACPTLHPVACTVGGPACGITGPQCPVASAFCPTPACPTQNQLACRPSIVVAQCPSLQVVHCPVPSVHFLHCGPSLVEICPSQRLDCLPSQGIHICPSKVPILCQGVSGAPGCGPQGPGPLGPGPIAAGVAHAAALGAVPQGLHFSAPPICVPINTLVACQTQHFIQCHPTVFCPVHTSLCPIQTAFCPVTLAGCPIQTQFCPSTFCPSIACGFGGFGGFGQ
jgi:hypothetical protein